MLHKVCVLLILAKALWSSVVASVVLGRKLHRRGAYSVPFCRRMKVRHRAIWHNGQEYSEGHSGGGAGCLGAFRGPR
jgi:hypothetical protein